MIGNGVLFAVQGASAKAEREETSLTTPNFSARGGRCQFLSRFVFMSFMSFRPGFRRPGRSC